MTKNISIANIETDKTSANRIFKRVLGANGILYEFVLLYNSNRYWEDAVDVRSIKRKNNRPSTAHGKEGTIYKPGQYQPIGDKRYFTYYQIKKMKSNEDWERFLNKMVQRRQWHMVAKYEEKILEIFGA
jgi:hypothetical protein